MFYLTSLIIITFHLFSSTLGTLVNTDTLLDSYDYIVVGGGLSGLVVASRLTEDSNVNVLVISDGPLDDQAEDTFIPRFSPYGRYARSISTAAQTSLNGGARQYAVGQVVGGGTVINGMLFIRGTSPDYDAWEQLGNDGWNWANMLQYFEKSETFTPQRDAAIAKEYGIGYNALVHGSKGPMQNGFGRYYWPQSANLFEGAAMAGVATVPDANDGTTAGAKFTPSNVDPVNMTRCSARNAYWDPNGDRDNLHLLTGYTVTRLVFDSANNSTSYGTNQSLTVSQVEFAASSSATRFSVNVTQEAIVSGGALFSPQILQLSGLGPRTLLENLGIDVLVDLPGCGENYQDHPMVDLDYTYENITDSPAIQAASPTLEANNRELYYANRTGPWTSWPSTGNLYPSLRSISNRSEEILAQADTQNAADYLPANSDKTVIAGYQDRIALNRNLLSKLNVHHHQIINDNNGGWTMSLMHPFSTGYVQASANDPFSDPVLDPRYSSNPIDNDLFLEGILWNRKLLDTPPMQQLMPNETLPTRNATDDDIRQLVRDGVRTEWHGCGTCSMRPLNKGGVVDNKLLVYGTANLRVIDASIMPIIIGANSQASLYAIAEKGADIIKAAAISRLLK